MHKAQITPEEHPNNQFLGFTHPAQNWFRMPNNWTDITAGMTSLAELKVVEYVLKHTWGYQEYGLTKRITTDEFMHGRRRKNGSRMDRGTGLSNRSVIDGLKKAVLEGFLREEIDDSDKGRVKKCYALKMLSETAQGRGPLKQPRIEPERAGVKNLHTTRKNLHTGVQNLHSRSANSSHRTEKDTLERYFIKPFNGDKSILKKLPTIHAQREKTTYIAEEVVSQLGDPHSLGFYKLVAAKVPEAVIYTTLAELRADGAHNPPKLFTYKINRYALEQLKKVGQVS